MTTFKKWYAINQDKLQDEYYDYLLTVEAFKTPMTFDEFVQDRWDSFDGYPAGIER